MQVSSLRIILMLDNIKWEDKIHLHQTAILLLSQNKIPNLFHTNNLIYIAPWYWHMPFLRHFTMNIITTAAQAKHYVIPLWGGATSSHLNSLGRIQAMRLPLGTVNLFGKHIIPPLTITVRYHFYTLVRWGTHGAHILPKDVTWSANWQHWDSNLQLADSESHALSIWPPCLHLHLTTIFLLMVQKYTLCKYNWTLYYFENSSSIYLLNGFWS